MSRSLWYESHLLADRAGRQARNECERLGGDIHERILSEGDRLAVASAAAAQQFYRRAAAVWQQLGPVDFQTWVELGQRLLDPAQPSRDSASIYFSLTAATVGRAGLARLRTWCELEREIAAHARKLGASFLQGTAPLIDKLDEAVLAAWAAQGLRLLTANGWKGEFQARSLFTVGAKVLVGFTADDIAAWVDLGVLLEPVVKQGHFFDELPQGLTGLKVDERLLLFSAAHTMAALDPTSARDFYQRVPAALKRVQAPNRLKLLLALRAAGALMPRAVADVAPVVGALLHDIARAQRPAALDLALRVADSFPQGVVALLRALPVAYEDAPASAVEEWIARGLQIAADNSDAGIAYFGLESRTSRQVLHASSTAAGLTEVQNVLRKYVHMLSGQSVSVRTAEFAQVRPPLEEFPLEDEIALPFKIDRFRTHEDNCRLYRFLAAQLAGRRLFGTYQAQLPDGSRGSLFPLLREPDRPELLEELFLVTEGFRIAARLRRSYPGLTREQHELAEQAFAQLDSRHVPAQSALLDALLLWLWSERPLDGLPIWLKALATAVAPCVQPLALSSATVDDSLTVAQELADALGWDTKSRREVALSELAFERMAGDAVLDMYMDPSDAPAVTAEDGAGLAGAPGDSDPANELEAKLQLQPEQDPGEGASTPMSAEELQRLLESGANLQLKQGQGEGLEGLGLYISDLLGKLPQSQIDELKQLIGETTRSERAVPKRWIERRSNGAAFYYDEWDYHIRDYRERWCRLLEIPVDSDSGEFFQATLASYAELIPEIRRQFQRIRPEMYRVVRGLEDGEDFDLNAVVDARVDRRAKQSPSPRLYVARTREERDVATLFLIDMSASTDEPITSPVADEPGARVAKSDGRRIIDVTKEALVVMAEALEEIGDSYAIYGFSGHGRSNVEFYLVKSFKEALSTTVKGRIGALEPKRSTRMGTALRHATEKMATVSARSRHMILLSDGFPQDFDYGQDRRSNLYGLRDTTIALREAEAAGIVPFCITVDKAGHDYLREMCDESRYMVIDDITSLPHELPKIYQRIVLS
ncbi:MAG TPA: VWA domain-containing protein [Terriglobales bacterium]|nr:VWA domain-containing protein [Terriglobales bacterium]